MIIAECAQNYSDIAEAKNLILAAKWNGADLAKFQLFDSVALYGKPNRYELSREQAGDLFAYGDGVGIEVFFSVFDVERVKWCEEIGVKRYKIACRTRDLSILDGIIRTGKPVYISSEGAIPKPYSQSHLLYCVPRKRGEIPKYDLSQVSFDIFDGLSDHTIGLDTAKEAISKGAGIIEKHFALSHEHGVDAAWSMTPDELNELKNWEQNESSVYM